MPNDHLCGYIYTIKFSSLKCQVICVIDLVVSVLSYCSNIYEGTSPCGREIILCGDIF